MRAKSKQPIVGSAAKQDRHRVATRGIPTTFWIQSEDLQRLRQFAAEHQLSASNVINRALRRFLSEPNPFFRS